MKVELYKALSCECFRGTNYEMFECNAFESHDLPNQDRKVQSGQSSLARSASAEPPPYQLDPFCEINHEMSQDDSRSWQVSTAEEFDCVIN